MLKKTLEESAHFYRTSLDSLPLAEDLIRSILYVLFPYAVNEFQRQHSITKVVKWFHPTFFLYLVSIYRKEQATMENYKKRIDELTALQRSVTQSAATEPPYCNEYYNLFDEGEYQCIVCGTSLFDSKNKFNAGCGWPAFSAVNCKTVTLHDDYSYAMQRIEVRCATCGAHLGHLFYDGPTPSGERYCINSSSLLFVPTDSNRTKKDINP